MVQATLPLEIYDHIIGFLYDDKDELKRTALVCKSWLASSRFHLFYSVTLLPPTEAPSHSSRPSPCKILANMLVNSTSLSRCVKELSLHEGSRHGRLGWAWMETEPSLPKLLAAVRGSLVTLCIQADPRERPPLAIRLARFPESLLNLADRMVKRQTPFLNLQHLRLKGMTLPDVQTISTVVAAMPALKDLELVHIRAASPEVAPRTHVEAHPLARKAALQSLQIISRDAHGFIRDLLRQQTVYLFDLRSLAYTANMEDVDLVNEIIATCPNSLETIELFVSTPQGQAVQTLGLGNVPDLSRTSNIKKVILDGDIKPGVPDVVEFAFYMLATIPPADNVLEEVSLTVSIDCALPADAINAASQSFYRLDNCLAIKWQFPHLKRVRVDFRLYENDPGAPQAQPVEDLAAHFLICLAALETRGLLYVDVSSV
ncbi:hypothetical protein BD626DRAFT_545001 [Schizophyllum amplum]|uniref:F-box domain-containing protein n=1 Tax=Schizophyllum amplum TaxID=97359 RepID=A0A550CS13_9AGAR|nr:hypothetical protein BD626DRAFT_545001 [Auriculariopsis ampla]